MQWQKEAPTRMQADAFLAERIRSYALALDANDMLYQVAASEDYNPAPDLERIKAPLLAINSADDQVNPPELGIMEAAMKRLKRGRYLLLPIRRTYARARDAYLGGAMEGAAGNVSGAQLIGGVCLGRMRNL